MRLLTIHLIRSGTDETADDTFMFTTVPGMPDLVKVCADFSGAATVRPGGFSNTFVLSRNAAYEYVMTLVGALVKDDDPYYRIQVNSGMFPSVIYNVSEIDEWEVSSSIRDIAYSTFNTTMS